MRQRYLAACVADHSAAESGLAQGVPWAAVPVTDGLKETLTAFLRGLEPLERDLFVGRYWYAYTPERLAQEQGLSRGAVNTRLMRTRNKLKDYLRKEGYTV